MDEALEVSLNRKIVISQSIDDNLAERVINQIMQINDVDNYMVSKYANYNPQPIEMIINSGGGHVSSGFAIVGAMDISQTPIITYGLGNVCSMAFAIYVAGDYRIASRYCKFMYHGIIYGMYGNMPDHEDSVEEIKRLQKMYDRLILTRTNIPKEDMQKSKDLKRDLNFSANESVKLGISDLVAPSSDARRKDFLELIKLSQMQFEQEQ